MKTSYNEKWKALSDAVCAKGADGDAFVEAMMDYYEAFDDEVLTWFAKLYDSKTGGFYYSNSARDNDTVEFQGNTYELKPDIESTLQALNCLVHTKVIPSLRSLPEKMRNQVIAFVHSLQDEKSGYILHPQWGTLAGDARRGRDLTWAKFLMSELGSQLPYALPGESKKSQSGEPKEKMGLPKHLESKEAFISYLEALEWTTGTKCYVNGNLINAQIATIKAAGLIDVAVEFFNGIQNVETGFWGSDVDYNAVNGYMKITTVYVSAGMPIPHIKKALGSILDCLSSDTEVCPVTWQYNAWFSIRNVVASLRKCGDEGNKMADEIVREALIGAPRALRATKKKVLALKKEDHAFSYYLHRAAPYSQGMPVCIPDTPEGDVNATAIAIGGTLICIYEALEIDDYIVCPFSDGAYERFLKALNFDE
jgi:hypothetical protein